jgi:endonuclease YncB( thermonuclease family)
MNRRVMASFVILASMHCAERPAQPKTNSGPPVAPAFEHLDECVNPVVENMAWLSVDGTVVEVTGARTFRLQTAQGMVTVSLPNIGEPYVIGARAMLANMIAGKRVSVMTRFSLYGKSDIIGEVLDAKGGDVSRRLLRAGAATFVTEPAYTLSGYSECLHRIDAREAKAERIGIWQHGVD